MAKHKETREQALFYQVGTEKLVELSLATFGLFSLIWSYLNWNQLQHRGEALSPSLRTLLTPVSQYDLYRRIYIIASKEDEVPRWKPVKVYVLYLIFTLIPLWLCITDHYWGVLTYMMTLLPNMLVNQTINRLHDKHLHYYAKNTDLTGTDWAVIIIGLVAWLTLLTYALIK